MSQPKTVYRDLIAKILLIGSFVLLIAIVIYWMVCGDEPERLFSLLAPLISTWIGTLLAFYFGRESFEAASKSYNEIINKISPDILDDILVKQVMIDKFTMVSIDVTNPMITTFDLKALRDFLDSINKTRLPILEGGKIKCIVHKSTFSDELLKITPANTLSDFINANPIVVQFEVINETQKVEDARKLINEKNCKDLFVVDGNNLVVGWLTDTQIIRYMNSQNL
ncbi:CBS domain-containing protein [Flavobacterium sp. LS1R49]|uniref:CBS domain-containing protein n=1 Tax=Flavobacterium shii TaxID=2987687 RepID=A0A9X2ZE81_9FLAO|nr:CBS domain-containing protein [Flavobacterium shii]MCV9929746.1 CBS domain-containing protein [Flavobacterium shii]